MRRHLFGLGHRHPDGSETWDGHKYSQWTSHRLLRGPYRRLADEIARLAPVDGAVLDVGCGPGRLLLDLADRRADLQLTGVDVSASMIEQAQENARVADVGGRITFDISDAANLPYQNHSFDLAVSSFSMHHWADVPGVVRELARVLRPGGHLRVYDFRFVSADELSAAAERLDAFTAGSPSRSMVRPTWFPVALIARYDLTTARPSS